MSVFIVDLFHLRKTLLFLGGILSTLELTFNVQYVEKL